MAMNGRTARRFVVVAAVVVAAMAAGLVASMLAIDVTALVPPPFRPEDDDTVRERAPVAFAYLAWAITSRLVAVAGSRWLRRA